MNRNGNASPKILSIGWGKMEIEDLGKGRDFKLWPGGGRPWDWDECGTGHSRGIQIDDVRELISQGAKVVILTRGVLSRLNVPQKTRSFIEEQNVEVIVTSTKQGVKLYNDYVDKNVPVAGLFHSTC